MASLEGRKRETRGRGSGFMETNSFDMISKQNSFILHSSLFLHRHTKHGKKIQIHMLHTLVRGEQSDKAEMGKIPSNCFRCSTHYCTAEKRLRNTLKGHPRCCEALRHRCAALFYCSSRPFHQFSCRPFFPRLSGT